MKIVLIRGEDTLTDEDEEDEEDEDEDEIDGCVDVGVGCVGGG